MRIICDRVEHSRCQRLHHASLNVESPEVIPTNLLYMLITAASLRMEKTKLENTVGAFRRPSNDQCCNDNRLHENFVSSMRNDIRYHSLDLLMSADRADAVFPCNTATRDNVGGHD